MKKIVQIIALVIGLSSAASATDINSIILSSGTETAFDNYIHTKGKRIIARNETEWNAFSRAVTLYNISPTEFLSMSESKKADFTKASETIYNGLIKLNTAESLAWAKNLKSTTAVFAFIWENKNPKSPIDLTIEVPKI